MEIKTYRDAYEVVKQSPLIQKYLTFGSVIKWYFFALVIANTAYKFYLLNLRYDRPEGAENAILIGGSLAACTLFYGLFRTWRVLRGEQKTGGEPPAPSGNPYAPPGNERGSN